MSRFRLIVSLKLSDGIMESVSSSYLFYFIIWGILYSIMVENLQEA